MQKKGFQVNLAIYQDIEKIRKSLNFKSSVGKLLAQIENEAKKDLAQYKQIKNNAKSVLSEFMKKADEIGVEAKNTQNYNLLQDAINDAEFYEKKLQKFIGDIGSAISSLTS
jgi:hypothetical protein